jgi:hypothetical protein
MYEVAHPHPPPKSTEQSMTGSPRIDYVYLYEISYEILKKKCLVDIIGFNLEMQILSVSRS